MPLLLDLFLVFAKIGLFTFGGGYAMLSVISENCVDKKKWITADDMLNITIIAETTPGPVAINCATFTGYRKAGLSGAIAATLGMIFPSFVVIYLISLFFDRFLAYPLVAYAFTGIKIGVGYLVLDAALGMMKKLPHDRVSQMYLWGICTVLLLAELFSVNISTIVILLVCAVIALGVFLVKKRRGGVDA